MTKLSSPSPGSDFDRSVMMRTLLSDLPSAPIPAGFDDAVLSRARSGSPSGSKLPWIVGSVALLFVASIIGFVLMRPNPVEISRIPTSIKPLVDLYNLEPLSVSEDLRFEHLKKPKVQRPLHGVAGY